MIEIVDKIIDFLGVGNIALTILSLLIGGAVSLMITTKRAHRSKLKIELNPQIVINTGDYGNKLRITVNETPVEILHIFNLEISLIGDADLLEESISNEKPCLRLDGFTHLDINTSKKGRDSDIFVSSPNNNKEIAIININKMRAGSTKRIKILGSFQNHIDMEKIEADFYPGFIKNTDIETAGIIKKKTNWSQQKFPPK